ncbi:MAG: hypothetical protein ABI268_06770 [Rhodanobacter sp.]
MPVRENGVRRFMTNSHQSIAHLAERNLAMAMQMWSVKGFVHGCIVDVAGDM